MKNQPLLEIDSVSIRYPGGFEAVRDVSFEIRAGERVGLVGESGSGKSSLARAILGLAPHSTGHLKINGSEFLRNDQKSRLERARQVQMIFQDPYHSLNPRRTIQQTLVEALTVFHEKTKPADLRKEAAQLLELVKLDASSLRRYPHQFSGGQRQRICIARALAPQPKLLVCDEAVSALDVTTQLSITRLLRELSEETGIALLFITHDIPVVEKLCEKILVLDQGSLVESGETTSLFRAPQHPQTRRLLGSVLRIE